VLVPLFDFSVPGPLGGYLDNVGEAETWGLEVEGSVAVTDALSLTFSAGWLDAEFTDGVDSFGNDLKGNQLPAARELTYAFSGSYRRPITGSLTFFADASYTYRDDGYLDVANNTEVSDAELLNASAGLEFGDFQVWGYWKNALDEDYQTAFGFRPPGSFGETRAEGETYGVTLKYVF
jgi:outer membrane cobalamin receptor